MIIGARGGEGDVRGGGKVWLALEGVRNFKFVIV